MFTHSGLIKWCNAKKKLAIFLAVLVLITSVQVLSLEEVDGADYSNVVVDAYHVYNGTVLPPITIPKINLSGANFESINNEIWNELYSTASLFGQGAQQGSPWGVMKYNWSIKDDVLSILVTYYGNGPRTYKVWTVTLPNGQRPTKSEVLKKARISEKDFNRKIKEMAASLYADYVRDIVNTTDKNEVGIYNNNIKYFTSDAFAESAAPYFNEQGELCAVINYRALDYGMWGRGGTEVYSTDNPSFAFNLVKEELIYENNNSVPIKTLSDYDKLLQLQAYPVNITREEADKIALKHVGFNSTTMSGDTYKESDMTLTYFGIRKGNNVYDTSYRRKSPRYYSESERYYSYSLKFVYVEHFFAIDTSTGELYGPYQIYSARDALTSPVNELKNSNTSVSGIINKSYTGKSITQSNMTVKYNGKTLTDGLDYSVLYKNNVKEGTATVEITGMGSYGGKITKTFKITHAHKYGAWTKLNNTQHQRVCSYDKTHIEKANHTWDSGKVTKAATETATGVKTYTCTTCKATKTETIPKLTPTQQSKIWNRLSGTGRYDTMKVIVDEGFTKTGGTVVIATGTGFKDALAASGLAGIDKGPVVLTDGNNLSAQSKAVLQRLKPKKIYVAGGTFAVKDQVLTQIRGATGVTPQRLYGQSSSGTSAALANAGKGKWKDAIAIIATNKSFKDALSVAPIAYAKSYPILLADDGKSLSKDVLNALKNIGTKQVIIVGGPGAVTTNVESQLKNTGITVKTRLWGQTGVATSKAIAEWGLKNGMTANKMGVATSQNYPDALAGAALCGYNRSVLVLADDGAQANTTFPKAYKSAISRGYVFGGEFAVGKTTFGKLEESVK